MTTLTASALAELLTRRAIKKLAGKRRYRRGTEAFQTAQVTLVHSSGDHVEATVSGGKEPAQVKLGSEDGQLAWSCTCRNGRDGEFCKHCVATALAWRAAQKQHAVGDGEPEGDDSIDEMRTWLSRQKKARVVDWLVEEARLDPTFYQWILEKMAPGASSEANTVRAEGQTIQELWAAFQQNPSFDLYQLLKAYTEPLREWPLWRERALHHVLRTDTATAQRPDRQEAVATLLAERAEETLKKTPAEEAVAREKTDPEESLAVYQSLVEPAINRKNAEAYSEALTLLENMKRVLKRLRRSGEFAHFVEELRERHKSKRAFIKLLDTAPWVQ